MQRVAKATRRGQTTISHEFRVKYGIEEGDKVLIEEAENGLLIRVVPKLNELAGVDVEYGTVDEAGVGGAGRGVLIEGGLGHPVLH